MSGSAVETAVAQVFEAIDVETTRVYGDQAHKQFGTLVGWAIGGPDPLDQIRVYWHPAGHWHYVGFGLSELALKETKNPEISGFGFELTLRLAAEKTEEPPTWPIGILNDAARYVFKSKNPLNPGDYLEQPGTPRWLLGVVADAELRPVKTPNGSFDFRGLIILDDAQFLALKGDDYRRFLAEHEAAHPLWVNPPRDS